jgi:2,3-bisphosphoglycerate-dependent phosphoglycerate mutase
MREGKGEAAMTQAQFHQWASPTKDSRDATLLLIRHGETTWNLEGRVQGHADSALTARGREQAQRIAHHLAPRRIDAVYASDRSRAADTALGLAAPRGLSVITRDDLRERCYGVLEGKTLAEAALLEESWFEAWLQDRHGALPEGESQQQMSTRCLRAVYEIAAAHPAQTVAIATHGGPIKSVVYEILHIPLARWRLTWIDNGSITVLRGTPEAMRVACFNDTCHLGGPPPETSEGEA